MTSFSLKKLLLPLAIMIALILGAYLSKFHAGLSNEQSVWGSFGDYFGGLINPIVSIVALLGAWYAYEIQVAANRMAASQFEKQNTISTFYALIDLHLKKVDSISIFSSNNEYTGRNAMRSILESYTSQCISEVLRIEKERLIKDGISGAYSHLQGDLLRSIASNQEISHNMFQAKSVDSAINEAMMTKTEPIRRQLIDRAFAHTREEIRIDLLIAAAQQMTLEERIDIIRKVDDQIYHDHGNEIGHYFRNMAQILLFISKSDAYGEEFRRVFRAQLSRYEIALLAYNCLSNRTSLWFNELSEKFDLFDDLYYPDIFFDDFDGMLDIAKHSWIVDPEE